MATMGPWSRVRVAKCQMLVTSFFVLVTGRPGGRGLGGWGAVSVDFECCGLHTHTWPCCPHPAPGTCIWGPGGGLLAGGCLGRMSCGPHRAAGDRGGG